MSLKCKNNTCDVNSRMIDEKTFNECLKIKEKNQASLFIPIHYAGLVYDLTTKFVKREILKS